MASALINVPERAKRGEIIEIKALVSHPMETGYRRTQLGAVIPRDIIRRFVCTYNGTEIFRADLHPAISANPFIVFSTLAIESGTLAFHWTGDNGFSVTESAAITVDLVRKSRGAPALPGRPGRRGGWGAISGPPLLVVVAIAVSAFAGEIPREERRSGYDFMGRETRAMQDDDTANPGLLWVLEGGTLWNRKTGAAGRACADCHGDARASMKGVAARHPAFDAAKGRPISLEQRINACRIDRQQAPPLTWESRELLALTAYVARQSRGVPIEIAIDARIQPFLDAGGATFHRRQGQLNLACSQCHDDNWGRRLAGNVIPQAHPTGYPLYRLEWQSLGSLQRRLRNCLVGMRAEPYEFGAPEFVDLELYLMWRARGMTFEAPAVRP